MAVRLEAQGAKGAEEAAPLKQGFGRPGEVAQLDVCGAEGVSAKPNRVSCRGRDATGRSSVIAGGVSSALGECMRSTAHANAHVR